MPLKLKLLPSYGLWIAHSDAEMQALVMHLSPLNHGARGRFWGRPCIDIRWDRDCGFVGVGLSPSNPPFTKDHTFCFSGMVQPNLKQAPRKPSFARSLFL